MYEKLLDEPIRYLWTMKTMNPMQEKILGEWIVHSYRRKSKITTQRTQNYFKTNRTIGNRTTIVKEVTTGN